MPPSCDVVLVNLALHVLKSYYRKPAEAALTPRLSEVQCGDVG